MIRFLAVFLTDLVDPHSLRMRLKEAEMAGYQRGREVGYEKGWEDGQHALLERISVDMCADAERHANGAGR